MRIPEKLKQGDEIRIISPSKNWSLLSKETRKIAIEQLEKLGFKVTFSKNINKTDNFDSSSIKSRVEDIHEAFKDKNVKAILTTIGGFNTNQILKYLDYDLIKSNPKIVCGYSDITALGNAIYAKTGLVTYSGPHFSSFGMKKGLGYTLEYFKKCLFSEDEFEIKFSKEYSDDSWYLNQEKRKFIKNKGHLVVNEGNAEGILIGGNLCTFNLLQGTEFLPSLKNSILFLEDDYESKIKHFDRDLQSVLHLKDFKHVKGLVIGRFQKDSEVKEELLVESIKSKKELNKIPVISNVDFGHTTPIITFPIGGKAKLIANEKTTSLRILKH
ncbi:MAG: S66 peptidase family protein [Nanoarchaeota archaeon]